jgi:hypothetical protein
VKHAILISFDFLLTILYYSCVHYCGFQQGVKANPLQANLPDTMNVKNAYKLVEEENIYLSSLDLWLVWDMPIIFFNEFIFHCVYLLSHFLTHNNNKYFESMALMCTSDLNIRAHCLFHCLFILKVI